MLYLGPGAAVLVILGAVLRYVRHLDDEALEFVFEFLKDLGEVALDAVNCFVHTVFLYLFMVLLGASGPDALPVAVSVGAIKIFSSDNVHPTNYFNRTRERIEDRWMRR